MRQSSVFGRQLVKRRWSLAVGRWTPGFAAVFLITTAGFAQQKTVVLKGGKLLTVSQGRLRTVVLVISAGKIAAIGAAGSVAIPGRAGDRCYRDDGLSRTDRFGKLSGIDMRFRAESSTNDMIETSEEIMPHMHVYDAFHAESELIPVAR